MLPAFVFDSQMSPALDFALRFDVAVRIGAPLAPTKVAAGTPRFTVPAVSVPVVSVIVPVALSVIVPEPVAVPTAWLPPMTMLPVESTRKVPAACSLSVVPAVPSVIVPVFR